MELQFLFYHAKGEAYVQVGERRKALMYFTESHRIVCEEETEWSFRAVHEAITCCCLKSEIDNTADMAPELKRVLEYLTGFESVEENRAVGQAHCVLFQIQLQANRVSEALVHADAVSKTLRQACQGFNMYPRFVYTFLVLLASVALHPSFALRLK